MIEIFQRQYDFVEIEKNIKFFGNFLSCTLPYKYSSVVVYEI